jgi:hypothetical protein
VLADQATAVPAPNWRSQSSRADRGRAEAEVEAEAEVDADADADADPPPTDADVLGAPVPAGKYVQPVPAAARRPTVAAAAIVERCMPPVSYRGQQRRQPRLIPEDYPVRPCGRCRNTQPAPSVAL